MEQALRRYKGETEMTKSYKIRETFVGARGAHRSDAFRPVASFEEARALFSTVKNTTIVCFEIDEENDAADVFLSNGCLYTVEAAA